MCVYRQVLLDLSISKRHPSLLGKHDGPLNDPRSIPRLLHSPTPQFLLRAPTSPSLMSPRKTIKEAPGAVG